MVRKIVLIVLILSILPFQLNKLYEKANGKVAGLTSISTTPILNSISIGEFRFNLFGYTSPGAQVTFDGQGVYDQTTADNNGYFEFKNRFSPFSPREACLSAKDQFGRVSSPVCLPPFPVEYNVSIGPIIISPTLSLNKDYYYSGDEIILSGQTVPNSEVDLSVFTQENTNLVAKLSLIKPVEAFTFPELKASSDSKGNFSIILPSTNIKKFRLFAQSQFETWQSPTSIKLNFKILPIWMIIFQIFNTLYELIKPRILEIIIVCELFIITYIIIRSFLHPYVIRRSKAIVLREKEELMIKQEYPLIKT